MKYFLVLAEEGSISAAAQRLFVAQQAFGEQMKRLETACGAVQGRYTCPLRRRSQCNQQPPAVMFPSANLIALFLWNRFYLVKANFAHLSNSFSCAKIAVRPSLSEPGCRISG